MKICAAGQELNNVSFMLEMIDRAGKCVWQKSEDRFQINHVMQLVITQLSVYASKLLKRKVYYIYCRKTEDLHMSSIS